MKKKISLSLALPISLNKKFKIIQNELKNKLDIKNYMINNSSLHINLISGVLRENELKKIYNLNLNKNTDFNVNFLGFGIFLNSENNNILYSRFSNSNLIYNIRNFLIKKIYNSFDLIDDTAKKKLWIPKATLAMRDFPATKINGVAKIISKYNLGKIQNKSKFLYVIDYTDREKIIKKIKIGC